MKKDLRLNLVELHRRWVQVNSNRSCSVLVVGGTPLEGLLGLWDEISFQNGVTFDLLYQDSLGKLLDDYSQ